MNTLVNYEVVDRAFAAFEEDLRGTPDYAPWPKSRVTKHRLRSLQPSRVAATVPAEPQRNPKYALFIDFKAQSSMIYLLGAP